MLDYVKVFDKARLSNYIKLIQKQNQDSRRLDGWFLTREIMMNRMTGMSGVVSSAMRQALLLEAVTLELPISIRPGEVFAGTEADAFARSYALINPDFKVDSFEGYCDEDAVYNDIIPNDIITKERIDRVRGFWSKQPYAEMISQVYEKTGDETREVVYFVERVTGHTIPDFSDALRIGIDALLEEIAEKRLQSPDRADYFDSMSVALNSAVILADRYSDLARSLAEKEVDPLRAAELGLISETCEQVPRLPARNLYEALQSYMILWQVMNLEQAPNPFAFSLGNIDRVLQPFLDASPCERELAAEMVRHFLAFFCVGDRNWAISQNIMAGGMDENGIDLTCEMSYVVLEAFEKSNYSQPNLSVKTHPGTPQEFYEAVARFMFEFGHSTPSFFNDPVVFQALKTKEVVPSDMPLYGAAGCQEPLIMGKESANTTNSWLNLAKVMELALNGGKSAITGKQIGPAWSEMGLQAPASYKDINEAFYKYTNHFISRMIVAANGCTEALAVLPVPFHSAFIGGRETGVDMRSVAERGTIYNGSGCLIHGLGNVADALSALRFAEEKGAAFGISLSDLLKAVSKNFEGADEIRDIVRSRAPKYGNDDPVADVEALELQTRVSRMVNSRKNPLGRPFCADWSTPSTNMLYGWWTGATPDGRLSRDPLSYGLDPVVESGRMGLLPRIASQTKLDFALMSGGSAVALSINPAPHEGKSIKEKADHLRDVIAAVFGYNEAGAPGLMYAYFNVFSIDKLMDVMKNPQNYPDPVLVRIHGQYGDARHLSPDILSGDVIPRLDPLSTSF